MKVIIPVFIIIILLVALVLTKNAHAASLDDISRKQVETSKIKALLNKAQTEKNKTQAQLNAELERIKQLEAENTDLKAKRQAKIEALKVATQNAQVRVVAVSGTCSEWLAQAGVTDIANATWLINKESGCNPNAVNKSSGACGIGQQLPCGKWEHQWNDPVGSIIDMQNYVMNRYGSWANAVQWHLSHNWY